MSMAGWIYCGLFAVGIILFYIYTKIGKLFKCIMFTAISGLIGLMVVWIIAKVTAIFLAITPLTILVSALLGIPGVLLMLLLQLL